MAIYYIMTREVWAEAQVVGEIRAESLATEGFIHCSRESQLLAVADRFFPGVRNLLVLAIDEAVVSPWLVNEGPAGVGDPFAQDVFPHIYAPIPKSAVIRVASLTAGADDRFIWPLELPRN